MKEVRPILAFLTTAAPFLLTGSLNAQGILSPNDFVIGIDGIRNNPGLSNSGAEGPLSAFDGNNSTKWLSFGRTFTGLIVTPATAGTVVQSLSFTTGGDAPERDPVSYQLFGTNSTINSVSDGSGLAETWTLIGGGATGLGASTSPSLARNTTGTTVTVANTTPYNSYKVLFTALRKAGTGAFDPVTLANASNPNSIQLSEVRMFDGASNNIFATTPISAIGIDQTDSFSPPTERPIEAIDGIKTSASKYLNFGREGAGLIITPAMGSSTVRGIQITTANDTIARDPSAYEIYGTNSAILSIEDSEGTAEAWTLITTGTMTLPDARNVDGDLYGFTNNTAYTSYKVIFTDNKGPDASANSIQFAEIQLFTVPEPASIGMLALGGLAMVGRRRNRK